MKITERIRGGGVETTSFALVATFALALALAPSAQAARNWNGSSSGNWATSGNWTGTTGRRYFKKENLSGSQVDRIYLSANVTETKNTGLCFDTVPDRGYWRLRSSTPSNIYTFDNSGNTGSDYDQDLICIGYAGRGSSAHFYGIKLKTRHLTVGGHASLGTNIVKYDMTGHLVLAESDINDDNNLFFGPATITTTKTCDFFKGDLYATNANITCQSTMKLYNFTADKTGGVWTVSGNLTIAAAADCTATFTNSGGDITCSGDFIFGDGAGSVGTFTLNSGTVTVPNSKWTKPLAGTGTLNLNGGTFVTQHIEDEVAGGSLTVNINGGTLKANNVHSKGWITHGNGAGLNVNVGENGGTIDTGAFNITVPVAINAVENTAGAFTVTGGGSATFSAMGNLAGAFTVGDNTTLHWFDQDNTVANYTISALNLGAGSTLCLDADATGCDTITATVTNIAATATICLNFLENVPAGTQYVLFESESVDGFAVATVNKNTGVVVPFDKSIVNGHLVVTVVADDFTWKNTEANWGDENAWTKGGADATWSDGNNAIFATDGAAATLAANAAVNEIVFRDSATVSGEFTLTAPTVAVSNGVAAVIAAPTSGALEKTGAGTLTLGTNRTAQTTVTEGTLKMASGSTVDGTKLTLGTDPAKPVTFDYAGQSLVTDPRNYLGAGMDVTLTNGNFQCTGTFDFTSDNLPATLTVASGARLNASGSARFSWNTAAGCTNTVNVAGGVLRAGHGSNTHWLMNSTSDGRIDFNVTDGGLLYFGYTMCALSCRGADAPSYNNPALHFRLVDSTLQVNTGDKDFNFGYDTSNRNPVSPEGVLAATNSVVTVGRSICIGHDVVGENTAGSYTADFEDSIVTARNFYVFWDRPLNNARFNNSRFVFNAAGEIAAQDGDAKWITVDDGGLTIDNRSFSCDLKANIGGSGTVTKIGSGILHIYTNQTATAALVCEEGETYVFDGRSVMRAITVKNGAKFTTRGTGQVTLASLSLEDGAELRVDEYRSGVTPIAVTTSVTLPASGTVTLTKNNNFSQGKYRILEKAGITVADVEGKLVPATAGELAHSWSVEGDTLFLIVGNPSAFTWTGFAGDGKMSTDGNWLGNVAPGAGDPADFSSLNRNEAIAADIDATFGTVTMGEGVITFTGSLTAASFSNTRKIAVDADSAVVVAGDLTIDFADGDGIVDNVDAGGMFVVGGILTITGGSVHPVLNNSDGYVVAGGIVVDSTLYSTKDTTSQKWAIGPSGMTGQNYIWCLNNKANDCWIHPYTNDFTISVSTVVRGYIDHHELNTTGYGDSQPHTITLDAGFADNGQLYIAGTGKFVVNSVPTAMGGKAAYSGNVTVTNTATLAINVDKKLTTGKITFASGTTLEVPSTGVEMGEIAFSGEGTVTLKVSDVSLADGEYTLITSTSDLPAGVATRFTIDAQTESRMCIVTLDNRSLRLAVGDAAISALPCIWTGAAGDGEMDTVGNWLGNMKPATVGANVLIPSETATINNNISGFSPSSITFDNGSGVVTISGNPITGVAAITNLSTTASHTIDVPVYFAGGIQVKQAAMAETGDLTKAHVTFAGGAYAAQGFAIENGNFAAVYSRCMFGKYYFATDANSPWTATVQGSGKRHCLADNSTLCVPYAGLLTELYIGNGAKVDVGEMAMGESGRVSYRNYGEMVVTNLMLSGTKDRFMFNNQGTNIPAVIKFDRIETSITAGNWCYFADGAAASRGVYYIGSGGLSFSSSSATGSYCIGKDRDDDAQTFRPWYSDFTIGDRGNGNACLVLQRDVTFCTDDESGTGRTITMDAISRGYGSVAPTITVSGSGTLRVNKTAKNTIQPTVTVTNTATLAIKPGAGFGASTMTFNSGTTLQVAESGTASVSNLTLAAGAMLGFNYTSRDVPVLNVTGKTVTFEEGATTNITVKISAADGKHAKGGANVLTSGGAFADATMTLAPGYPDWVKGVSVVDGEIVLDVKPRGTVFIIY